MIAEEKKAAVTRGLGEAFGVTEVEEIRELTGGVGANPVFRIVVRGSAFLLRINQRAGDLGRHYGAMRAAAEAGLAPRVWYTSVEERISITDFVETAAFPAAEALVRIPAALRRLHALPAFPRVPAALNNSWRFLLHKGPALEGFLEKFRAANLLPQEGSEELFSRYAELAAVYPLRDGEMVSSHNDLFKPDNLLFDGERLWLVDWEAAFLNDRYADLSVAANLVVSNDEEETAFLREYFGATPDAYRRARFFLARQMAHLFYAMVFLWLGSAGQAIEWSEAVPEFGEFQKRFWAGGVNLKDRGMKILYGRVHWERLRENARQARYGEALRVVAERPT